MVVLESVRKRCLVRVICNWVIGFLKLLFAWVLGLDLILQRLIHWLMGLPFSPLCRYSALFLYLNMPYLRTSLSTWELKLS